MRSVLFDLLLFFSGLHLLIFVILNAEFFPPCMTINDKDYTAWYCFILLANMNLRSRSLYAVAYVCRLSVCLSVTLVHHT